MRLSISKPLCLLLIPLLISGCVAQTYEIHPDEVSRILEADPAKRGEMIQVHQETSESVVEREPVGVWHPYHHHHHGHFAPPPRRFRRGFGPQSQDAQTKEKIADEKEAAILFVIIAIGITMAAVGTEGSRFQGFVSVDPNQPVHIVGDDGSYAWNYLASLKTEDLQPGDRLIIAEDEGEGFTFHERLPLDREGFVWRLELGSVQNILPTNETVMGPAARMFLGYFPSQTVGLGFMTQFMGGTDGDADFFNTRYGLELQAMPFNAGSVHLGLYGWGGFAYNLSSGGRLKTFENHSSAAGAGLMLEWDLNTTLGLTLRAGGSWESQGESFDYRGITTMFGVSVY